MMFFFLFSNFYFRDLSRSFLKCDVGRAVSGSLVTVFLLTCQKTITSLRNLGAMEIFSFVIWVLFIQIIKSNYPIKIVFIRLANFQYVRSFANEWKFINYKRAMLNRNNVNFLVNLFQIIRLYVIRRTFRFVHS